MNHLPRPEGFTAEDLKFSRRALGGLLFAGYALGAGPLNAAAITTDTEGLFTASVTIPADGVQMPGYIAMPEGAKKRPVVIVVSEVFGLHEYIRDICRRLAKAGYVAIAPDLFVRHGNPAPLDDFNEIRKIVTAATNQEVMADLDATIDYVTSQPALGQKNKAFADPKKIGVTGFCWGGAVVWMAMASLPRLKAGAAWYGRLTHPKADEFLGAEERQWPIDVADRLHGPVLGQYGGLDKGIGPDQIEAMRAALAKAHDKKSQIIVYPDAQHGFHADYRSSYNEADAKLGWQRMLDWFKKYLK